MNKPKWTPGPWEVFEHMDHSGLEIGPPRTDAALKGCVEDVCKIRLERLLYDSDWYKEKKSNANLIAAAPELYEVVEAFCFAASFEGLAKDKAWQELLSQGRAALAKAGGEGK